MRRRRTTPPPREPESLQEILGSVSIAKTKRRRPPRHSRRDRVTMLDVANHATTEALKQAALAYRAESDPDALRRLAQEWKAVRWVADVAIAAMQELLNCECDPDIRWRPCMCRRGTDPRITRAVTDGEIKYTSLDVDDC